MDIDAEMRKQPGDRDPRLGETLMNAALAFGVYRHPELAERLEKFRGEFAKFFADERESQPQELTDHVRELTQMRAKIRDFERQHPELQHGAEWRGILAALKRLETTAKMLVRSINMDSYHLSREDYEMAAEVQSLSPEAFARWYHGMISCFDSRERHDNS